MSLKNILQKEPVAIGAAITAVLNALVLLNVVSLDVPQITGVNIALVAILGLLTRRAVTPNPNVVLDKATTHKRFEEIVVGTSPDGEITVTPIDPSNPDAEADPEL